jgi:large subunit ribosomal protein L24
MVAQTPSFLRFLKSPDGAKPPERSTINMAIPISAVRLVHPVTDHETGTTRDVIIRELRSVNFRHDRLTRTTEWDRYVPGLNIVIPWPDPSEPDEKVYAVDTPREYVQEQTFVPTLLAPPMPPGFIDRLRNPYSRFRTRHEAWYIAEKEAAEAEKKRVRQFAKEMRTPIQELRDRTKAERKARGEPDLTEEMLEKIGEVMARNLRLDQAGVAERVAGLEK